MEKSLISTYDVLKFIAEFSTVAFITGLISTYDVLKSQHQKNT